jgi:hypothetical protein
MAVMSSGRLEGAADVGLYGVQGEVKRPPVPIRSAVPELLLQRRACACTHGGGCHAATVAGMVFLQPSAST